MIQPRNRIGLSSLAILLLFSGNAQAQDPSPPKPPPSADEPLRKELEELRAKQHDLERRLEASEAREAHQAKEAKEQRLLNEAREIRLSNQIREAQQTSTPPLVDTAVPRFRIGRDGFAFSSGDGKFELRLRAVLHFDGRVYVGSQSLPDTFVIRRARPFIEGTLFGLVDFRLMPDFAYGQATIADAYVELHPWAWLRLRGGRFRVPIGLEWLQSDSMLSLVERSLVTDLVPWRDLGVMLWGDIADGTFCYQLGMFNGAPDSANGPDLDPQSTKDFVGRIFLRPLRRVAKASWVNLGFGFAGSYGRVKGTATATNLPSYRSTGQQPIFSYITSTMTPDATTLPAGDRWRASPQMYLYMGPVGLLAEYVLSAQHVERLGNGLDVVNQAWNLTANFVLTLEHASYDGVMPKHPVDFRHKAFGAFELTFRYSELQLDPSVFPTFADPSTSVRSARELGGSLNWYMTEYVRVMFSFQHTDFVGGAAMGTDREPENALLARLQLSL